LTAEAIELWKKGGFPPLFKDIFQKSQKNPSPRGTAPTSTAKADLEHPSQATKKTASTN